MEPDSISHYGILGMRWGVRKQPNGGKARTGSPQDQTTGYEPKNPGIGEGGEPPKIGSSSVSDRKSAVENRRSLSTSEIKERIDRLKLERELKTLTNENLSPSKTVVNKILSESGQKVAKGVVAGAATYAIKAALEKKFDPVQAASYIAPKPKNR